MGLHAISKGVGVWVGVFFAAAYGRYQYTTNYGSGVQVRQLAPLIELEY